MTTGLLLQGIPAVCQPAAGRSLPVWFLEPSSSGRPSAWQRLALGALHLPRLTADRVISTPEVVEHEPAVWDIVLEGRSARRVLRGGSRSDVDAGLAR
jgi:hypothetical protein